LDEWQPAGTHVNRRCEISREREPKSPRPGGQRQGTAGRKRQTAAVSEEPGRQDPENIVQEKATEQELAELRRLRQSLVQVAQEIFATFGVDPEEGSTAGPRFGPGARGMGRPGMMGRRMRGQGAHWDEPGPMRRMPPPGRRGYRGMEGPFAPRRHDAVPADEDGDTDG
jgi:hypothetical protein